MQEPGFCFCVALLLTRCTRGQDGVPFVIKYITCHWHLFVTSFGTFCNNLVSAAERVCARMGSTHLAHHDGLAAGLSGLQFLRTLREAECRKSILKVARDMGPVFTRLLVGKGRSGLSAEEFLELGEALIGKVCLAIHSGRKRFMGGYNAMDSSRCVDSVLRYVLRAKPVEYTDAVHAWLLKQQASKFRTKQLKDMFYFGIHTSSDMTSVIAFYESICTGAVTFASVLAHFCEVRQCINKFSLAGVALLIKLYYSVPCASKLPMCALQPCVQERGCSHMHVLQ